MLRLQYYHWLGFIVSLACISIAYTAVLKQSTVLAVVIPHHNVVQDRRENLIAALSQNYQPQTIVLISPNHFNTGGGKIITTNRTWVLHNGSSTLVPNQSLINTLTTSYGVQLYDPAFYHEHGITNLLGEIKTYFPNAKFLPLIVKESLSEVEMRNLALAIQTHCRDCGVIASVDMSHYKPAAEANANDAITIQAFDTLDQALIWTTDVDSHASLSFLMHWAQLHNQTTFELVDHTNSGELIGNPYTETTSHIFGYYTSSLSQMGRGTPRME